MKPIIVNEERFKTKVLPLLTRLVSLGYEMNIESVFNNKTHWKYHNRELVELEFRHHCLGHICYNFVLNHYTWYKIHEALFDLVEASGINESTKLWEKPYLFGNQTDFA